MKVIVGSNNPVKIEVAKQAFSVAFPEAEIEIVAHSAVSGVSDQPMSTKETRSGAENRAKDCQVAFPEADYWVGQEGGLVEDGEDLMNVAWICVINQDGRISSAPTAGFPIPAKMAVQVKAGEELGTATDIVFGAHNSKQREGTTGMLTDGYIDRVAYYVPALIFALLPFTKPELYR